MSPRGNLVKEVGEPASVTGNEGRGVELIAFNVTDIEVDPKCPAPYATKPENGHFVALTMEAKTGAEPDFSKDLYNGVSFHPGSWKMIASNGTTVNEISTGAAFGCFEEQDMMPSQIGPAEKVSGKIVFDVPDTAGTLVYSLYEQTGWEWEFGKTKPNA
jgi:hypothetical protein